ncbi:hypothetical protein C8R45DRAFT_929286 [Mycena sanguinolenta]|nr:hypothetical protein C8R45DRAFT_929286 [Mycena sanguinolenta]
MDLSDIESLAYDDVRNAYVLGGFGGSPRPSEIHPSAVFKSPRAFEQSADDLANLSPSFWAGMNLQGDREGSPSPAAPPLSAPPIVSLESEMRGGLPESDEEIDQLESTPIRPPSLSLGLGGYGSTEDEDDYEEEEEEEQVGGGGKWREASGPETPTKLRTKLTPTTRADSSMAAAISRRADLATSVEQPPVSVPTPNPLSSMGPPPVPSMRKAPVRTYKSAARASASSVVPMPSVSASSSTASTSFKPCPPPTVPIRFGPPGSALTTEKPKLNLFGLPTSGIWWAATATPPPPLTPPPLPPPPPPPPPAPCPSLMVAFTPATPITSPRSPQLSPSSLPLSPTGVFTPTRSLASSPSPGHSSVSLSPGSASLSRGSLTLEHPRVVLSSAESCEREPPIELRDNLEMPSDEEMCTKASCDNLEMLSDEEMCTKASCTGKLTTIQEEALDACCTQMMDLATGCSVKIGLPIERVLRAFDSHFQGGSTRSSSLWNRYQPYANHADNRATERGRLFDAPIDTTTSAEVPPLTVAELKEAYHHFKAAYSRETIDEILNTHFELVSSEMTTTVAARQRQFQSNFQQICTRFQQIHARHDFDGLCVLVGPHVNHDGELADIFYTPGLAGFFEKARYSEDSIIAMAKLAVYDHQLDRVQELRGESENNDNGPSVSALASASAMKSSRRSRSKSKAPSLQADAHEMKLADDEGEQSRSAKVMAQIGALRERIHRASREDVGGESVWKTTKNGLLWTVACPNLWEKGVRVFGFPGTTTVLPPEAPPAKSSGAWASYDRKAISVALDARGTLGEGWRHETYQYRSQRDIVIFSHDYSRQPPPIGTPAYKKHWRPSGGHAVPCADGYGGLWLVIYDLDGPKPIISQTPMSVRAPNFWKDGQKGKGKGKGKATAVVVAEHRDDGPPPQKKMRGTASTSTAPPRTRTRSKAQSQHHVEQDELEDVSLESEEDASSQRSKKGTASASASASTPAPASIGTRSTRSTRASATAAAIPNRTRSATASGVQEGGGNTGSKRARKSKTVRFDLDVDSEGSADGYITSSGEDDGDDEEEEYDPPRGASRKRSRVSSPPGEHYRTIFSPQDGIPIGTAYLTPDGSIVGMADNRTDLSFAVADVPSERSTRHRQASAPAVPVPPQPLKRGQQKRQVVAAVIEQPKRPQPRALSKKRKPSVPASALSVPAPSLPAPALAAAAATPPAPMQLATNIASSTTSAPSTSTGLAHPAVPPLLMPPVAAAALAPPVAVPTDESLATLTAFVNLVAKLTPETMQMLTALAAQQSQQPPP